MKDALAPETTLIECRCGAVAVELSGEPLLQFYCHCDHCQAVHGAAFVIQCRFALLPVRDDLPHYRALPERLGGSDETVDW